MFDWQNKPQFSPLSQQKDHFPPGPDALLKPVYWRAGEHVACVGTNGTGKTYLVSKLVDLRDNVIILRTKPDDIEFDGFREFRTAKPMDDWRNEKLLIIPKYENQPQVCFEVLEKVWKMGRWTIVVDEFFYVQRLGLMRSLERLLTQGRSKRISLVLGMQRPVQVTRFALSEITHLFSFRIEGRDLKTLKDSTHPDIYAPTKTLQKYQFMHYHAPSKTTRIGYAVDPVTQATTLSKVILGLPETLDDVLDPDENSSSIDTRARSVEHEVYPETEMAPGIRRRFL